MSDTRREGRTPFGHVHDDTPPAERPPISLEQLAQQIHETADKLIRDRATRGAVALFPGGFGTQDEGFEVLTLVQTGKSHLFPIVLVDEPGGDYWTRWQEFVVGVLVARKLIAPEDLSLYRIRNSVAEAIDEVLG